MKQFNIDKAKLLSNEKLLGLKGGDFLCPCEGDEELYICYIEYFDEPERNDSNLGCFNDADDAETQTSCMFPDADSVGCELHMGGPV